ncbi:MAG: CDP-glycerol glycerophosphotransferase family protein [Leucobacter sp.]
MFTSETNRAADIAAAEAANGAAEKRPLFSIVPACYAVRRYLPDFLASLDAQDFDKSRCELVFVVDGCPENSGEVIRKWMPTTDYAVRLIEKENGGVASARNLGFSLARGSWIMTPDPDDTLDPAYLSHLAAAIEEFPSETMFVSCMRTATLDGAPLPHPLDFRFAQQKTRVIDLQQTPEQIHLSGGTGIWSSEVIQRAGLRFDERLRTGSDADFNLRYLIENGARYVVAPRAVYHYLKRGDGTSIIDRATKSYSRYEVTIGASHSEILDRAGDRCPQWLANSLLYAVYHLFRGCLRPNSPAYMLTSEQRRSISRALRDNLARIGAENILGFNVVDLPFEIRCAWLAAVGPLTSTPVVLRETNAVTQHRRVGFYASTRRHRFTASTSERPKAEWTRKIRAVEFLGETWCYEHLVRVEAAPNERVKLRSRTKLLEFAFGGQALTEKRLLERMGLTAPAMESVRADGPPAGAAGARQTDEPSPVPSPRGERGDADRDRGPGCPPEPDGAWVIDVPSTGSRSALPLYDHIRASRPSIPLRLVADAELAERLREVPDGGAREIVPRGTARHRQLMEGAAVLVSSDLDWSAHNRFDAPGPKKSWRFVHLPEHVRAWPDYRRMNRTRPDATVVSAPFETDALCAPDTPYGVDSDEVWTVGLPYQDRLRRRGAERSTGLGTDGSQHVLLIAPSSRRDWGVPGLPGLAEHLSNTEFVRRWRSLLADPRLESVCSRYGMRARFVAPEGYGAVLQTLELPTWIEVRDGTDNDELFADVTVCLTDYSEVAFDAALCAAPTVYFQFDRAAPERESLLSLPGSFDFEAHGFGPVTDDEEAVFEALDLILDTAGTAGGLPAAYRRRIETCAHPQPSGSACEALARSIEASTGSAVPVYPPSISLVVNCGSDPALLDATLSSIGAANRSDTAVSDAIAATSLAETLLVVETENSEVVERARLFSESQHGSVSVLELADVGELRESELRGRLSGAWVCSVVAGVSLTERLRQSLSRLLVARPELEAVAVYPAYAGENPFPTRHDVVERGVGTGRRTVVELADFPTAFSAMSVCGLFRTDLLFDSADGAAANATDFLHLGAWAAAYRGIRRGGLRMGLLNGAVEAAPGTRAPLRVLNGTREEVRRFLFDSANVLESLSGDAGERGEDGFSGERGNPVLSSVITFLAVRALRRLSAELWESDEELDAYRERLARVLDALPPQHLSGSHWAQRNAPKYALCSVGGLRPHVWRANADSQSQRLVFEGCSVTGLAKLETTLMSARVLPDCVEVEAFFIGYRSLDLDLVLSGPHKRVLRAVERSDHWQGIAERFDDFVASPASYRRFRIPLSAEESSWQLGFLNENTGRVRPCLSVFHGDRSPFRETRDYTRVFNDHGAVALRGANSFLVTSAAPNRRRYNRDTVRALAEDGIEAPDRRFARNRKTVLLITDRPKFGDDNGEALFRYIQKHRRDLRRRTWLVLDRSAPSYAELKSTGRIVEPGSSLHRRLYLNARILFASHLPEAYNNPFFAEPVFSYADETDFTFVWLQHGITMNSVGGVFSRLRRGHDGVVVGGRHELEFASDPDLALGHRVLKAGFPRFDLLENRSAGSSATLLYMPTWRAWLTGERQADGTSLARENLADEEYYTHQRAFLTDPALLEALGSADARIEMMLHPAMSAYQHLYRELASDRVVIHPPGQVRYRDLFAKGAAMITDYSSVFFDFAYLGKPVIFDHSDVERFRAQHYREGLFSYERDAPGPISHSLDELLEQTLSLIGRGFAPDPAFEQRLDDLYLFRDRSNSHRVLEQALEIDRRRRAGSQDEPGG